jgi:hypothetical protein
MVRALTVAAVVALAGAGLAAQGHDFSGTWTIDAERMTSAAGSGGMMRSGGGGGRGGAVVGGGGGGGAVAGGFGGGGGAVARSGGGGGGRGGAVAGPTSGSVIYASTLSITMGTGSVTVTAGANSTAFKTDGSVSATHDEIGETTTKAAWNGDKLIITTANTNPIGTTTVTTTWYLDGQNLVREVETAPANGSTPTKRTTYFKKS